MSILFLDNNRNNLKINKSINVILFDKKKINFIILLKSIFNFTYNLFNKSLSYYYLENLCEKFKPKIIIGDQFNQNLFLLKEKFPDVKTYMYFSYLMSPRLQREYINNIHEKKKIDYFFLPHKKLSIFLKKKIEAKYISSGFLKNNEMKIKKNFYKRYDLMVISEYRNNIEKEKLKKINLALKILEKISKKYDLKICIAFVSKRADKSKKISFKKEKIFYDKFSFKYSISNLDSYSLSNYSKVIFSMNSNLGYELFARGQKVLFFSNGQKFFLENFPFICEAKDMEAKIIKLLKINTTTYNKKFKKKNLIEFDKGNKIFKEHLKKDLKKKSFA